MPKIEIETCKRTPNYCALEAIAIAMNDNYTKRKIRDYKYESIAKVKSGRTLKVVETKPELREGGLCSCKYSVELAQET